MIHGLMWLPLLAVFIGLAWAGWNEYSKLEAYKLWAQSFERAKYDIYAALGQQGDVLTWGVPTRKGVIKTESLNLAEVATVVLEVDTKPVEPIDFEKSAESSKTDTLPTKGRFTLGFTLKNGRQYHIPFTEGEMAAQWLAFLRRQWHLPGGTGDATLAESQQKQVL
jgi:hypothetical protein